MEPFTNVVRRKVHQLAANPIAIERQRYGAAIGEKGRSRVFLNAPLIDREADGILRIQQRVQMTTRDMSFLVRERQLRIRADLGTEKGKVVVVSIENAAHILTTQTDGIGEICAVDIAQPARSHSSRVR